jgi:uncharacterized protein (TIGR03790 family)
MKGWRKWLQWLMGLGLVGLAGCEKASLGMVQAILLPKEIPPGVNADTLGIIVNQADPLSQQIAQYYQQQRQIPDENIIRVRFAPDRTVLPVEVFERLWILVQAETPEHIQAYALTWAEPYRVGCMSITAAFAFGFDETFCAEGCQATATSPYFNSFSNEPFDDLQIRPTMALAATDLDSARALIDRGIDADGTQPSGTAYLMSTSDPARNVRSSWYADIKSQLEPYFGIQVLDDDQLTKRTDVMFYFTGLTHVKDLDTNQYLPGAVADHLTSLGGKLTDSPQMSSLRWLEAGATGSYGTVIEPCNFPQKFPHPGVLMAHYLNGDTLIEAYWKSVLWPGQGIFVGEPLARPFGLEKLSGGG